jgi:hypothetical protein
MKSPPTPPLCANGCGKPVSLNDRTRGPNRLKGTWQKVCSRNCGRRTLVCCWGHTKLVPEQGRGKCRVCNKTRTMARRTGIAFEVLLAFPVPDTGACDLCGTIPTGDPWNCLNLDHDHESGELRGWLCGPCNRALGLLRDDPKLLRRAAKYVEGKL